MELREAARYFRAALCSVSTPVTVAGFTTKLRPNRSARGGPMSIKQGPRLGQSQGSAPHRSHGGAALGSVLRYWPIRATLVNSIQHLSVTATHFIGTRPAEGKDMFGALRVYREERT